MINKYWTFLFLLVFLPLSLSWAKDGVIEPCSPAVLSTKPMVYLSVLQNIRPEALEKAGQELSLYDGQAYTFIDTRNFISLPDNISPTMGQLVEEPQFWGNQELLFDPSEMLGFKYTWEDPERVPSQYQQWEGFVANSSNKLLQLGKMIVPTEISQRLNVAKGFFRYNGHQENLGKLPHPDQYPLVSVTLLDDVDGQQGTVLYPDARSLDEIPSSSVARLPRGYTVFFYGKNLVDGVHSPLAPGLPLTHAILHHAGFLARMVYIQAYSLN